MPRYIDADWITQKLEGWQDQLAETYGENDEYVLCLAEVLMKLDDTPTADVVERKKGKWIDVCGVFRCSKCEKCYPYATDYCPNCGAEMSERSEE